MSTNQEALLKTDGSDDWLTVAQLVDNLVQQKGLEKTKAIETVYTQWKKGVVKLSEANPAKSITQYFFSLENIWFWAITALTGLTIACVFTVESSTLLYVRYALGAVFVLFMPGFMLISALYPRSEEMDGLERLALSIGLSLAIVPLVGLALNYTLWGIRLAPIVVSLAAIVELLAVVCVVRRFRYKVLNLE